MFHLGRAPAWPWQTVIFTVERATHSLQRRFVKRILMGHMFTQALRRLAGIANGPHASVELAGNVFNQRFVVLDLDVLEHLVGKTQFFGQLVGDRVIGQRFKQQINHLFTPLDRPVGGRYRTIGFKLRTGRQQIDAVRAVRKHGRNSRIGIDHDQQVEFFHCRLHFFHAGLGIGRMPPEDHAAHLVRIVHIGGVFKHPVNPARNRNAGHRHQVLVLAVLVLDDGKAALDIVDIGFPDAGPMAPGTGAQAIITRQGMRQHAQICGALHIVMATENIGSAARLAHVAQRQLQDAIGARVVVAIGMLRATHAPDDGTGTILGQRARYAPELRAGNAGNMLNLLRIPIGDFAADLIHAPDTLADELFVLPAIFKNVPKDAPNERHIGARTKTHIFVGMGCRTGKARVTDDHRRIVLLFRLQQVKKRNRMGFGRVAANDEYRPGIVNVVIGVCHRSVAPGVGNTCNRGGVTDTRLVIDIVGAPIGSKLAHQIGLLIVVLRGSSAWSRQSH